MNFLFDLTGFSHNGVITFLNVFVAGESNYFWGSNIVTFTCHTVHSISFEKFGLNGSNLFAWIWIGIGLVFSWVAVTP